MPNRKIMDVDVLAVELQKLKAGGKKIIHCQGVFDLVHLGHIRYLGIAKSLGDVLAVTVTTDKYVNKGPGRPVFNQELRAEAVAALECVDYVAINHWPTAVETIKRLKPDIFVYGGEYTQKAGDETRSGEREAVESIGGKIHFTDEFTFNSGQLETTFSSSSLLNEHFGIYPEQTRKFLRDLRARYTADEVVEKLRGLKDLRVLVIGETILDQYCFVFPLGKSPKGNHITARFLREEVHAGGILACANHLANFCGAVELITAVGDDGNEEFVRSSLKPNINLCLFHSETPTIVKRRFVDSSFLQKLFELETIDDRPSPVLESQIETRLGKLLSNRTYDLVLVLDYGHGLLTPSLIKLLCGQRHFLAVNAQTNTANMGFNFITKYPRANYFCLDDRELRLALQDNYSDIRYLIMNLAARSSLPLTESIAITRGHLGTTTYDVQSGESFEAPVLSQKIVDTTGAGDAFLALTAPCVAKGFPMDLVAFIGNAAGALAVGYLGNKSSIEAAPFFKFITALLK